MGSIKSKIRQLLSVLFLGFFLLAAGIVGCDSGKQETDPVKVGIVLPFTGPISFVGELAKQGIEMAMEDLSQKSGETGVNFELVYSDNKGVPKETLSIMQKNISIDKIRFFLVGPTPAAMSAVSIVNDSKVIMFVASTHPYITDKSPYIFRTAASNAEENELLLDYAKINGIKSIGTLYVEDDFGLSAATYFKDNYEGKVKIEEPYDMRKSDFRPQLIKLKQASPEAYLIHGYGVAFPAILKQMLELGMTDRPILSDLGFSNPPVQEMLKILPKEFADKIVFSAPAFSKEFTAAVQGKFSKMPNFNQAYPYDFIKIIYAQIAKYGTDVEKIRESILKIQDYSGAFENIAFLPNGDSRRIVTLMKIENGKIVPLN